MALSVQGLQRTSPGPLSETQMRAWVPEQTRRARNSGAPSSQPLSRASVQVMLVQAQAAAGSGSRLAGPMAWGHFIGDKHQELASMFTPARVRSHFSDWKLEIGEVVTCSESHS